MPNFGYPQEVVVKVGGTALSQQLYDALLDVRVEQSLWVASRFSVRLRDPDFHVIDSDTFAVAKDVEIGFKFDDGAVTTVFKGEIVSIASDQGAGRLHELVVGGYDKSHRLGHESRIRSFQNMTFSDIVSQIAGEHGLSAQTTATSVVFTYLLQTSTDHAFVTELAFRVGYDWWVDDGVLHFAPRVATTGPELELGTDLVRFKARFSASGSATEVNVKGWDGLQQQVVQGQDGGKAASTEVDVGVNNSALHTSRSAASVFTGPVATSALLVETADEADQVAASIGRMLVGAECQAKGEVLGLPSLKPGCKVKIKGVGRKLAGDYFVTAVEHVFAQRSGLVTRFTSGGVESTSLVDLLGRRDERAVPWGRDGVVVGVVTNNKDPESWGRVKVKFRGLSDEEESNWARLAQPGAGEARGAFFMPQVDDEVLVAFEQGDLRRPFVLGGLWSSKAAPPSSKVVEGENVTDWLMQTKSGHIMLLRDGDGDAKKHFSVVLADGKTTLFVGQDKVQVITAGKMIEIKDGRSTVVLDGNGAISLKGTDITIEAQNALKLSGQTVAIDGKTGVDVKGLKVEVKADSQLNLQASGMAALKGSIVMVN